MSVYDLYQSYLNQAKASPVMASPVVDPNYLLYLQQQQAAGGENDNNTNVIDPTQANAGINSFSDAFSAIQGQMTPGSVIGGLIGGIPGALVGRGIGNLVSNFQNQYTGIMGNLNATTQAAINRELQRDFEDRMGRGEVDFSGGISAAQDAARGGYAGGRGGDHDGGASASAQGDAAAGMGGY